jgi:hypothetical protein
MLAEGEVAAVGQLCLTASTGLVNGTTTLISSLSVIYTRATAAVCILTWVYSYSAVCSFITCISTVTGVVSTACVATACSVVLTNYTVHAAVVYLPLTQGALVTRKTCTREGGGISTGSYIIAGSTIRTKVCCV